MNTFIYAFLSVAIVAGPVVVAAFCGWMTNETRGGFFRGIAFSWVVAIFLIAATLAVSIAGATTLWSLTDDNAFVAWTGIAILWVGGGYLTWALVKVT